MTKHDYVRLEREYLNSDLSIRELAKKHDIKSYSVIAAYARSHGWYDRRHKIKERVEEKIIERVSERVADVETDRLVEYRDDLLNVVRAAIYKFAQQLADPDFRITPPELIKLGNLGLILLGQPTERTEERRLELSGSLGDLPPEFLARLAEATRPRALLPGRDRDDPPAGSEGTRPN